MRAGRSAIHFAGTFGRSQAHAAEEWFEGNLDAGREGRNTTCAIQGNDLRLSTLEFIRQEARALAKTVVGEGYIHTDFTNPHFQHVARFGAFDGNRSG